MYSGSICDIKGLKVGHAHNEEARTGCTVLFAEDGFTAGVDVRGAAPGTRETGSVSIAVQYYSEPKILFNVSRGSFMPSPDVDSCVIRLDVRPEPAVKVKDEKHFFKIVHGAFSQRRKTLSNCLSGYLKLSKTEVAQLLEQAGVAANARAEQLSMEQFAAIADAYTEMIG